MRITFEERYFKNEDEWDYFLSQLDIPEEKRIDIDEIELDVSRFMIKAIDIDGNKVEF